MPPDWVRSKSPRGIIDCYVNGNPPDLGMEWGAADYLFGRSRSGAHSADGLVEHMDAHGIARALLTPPPEGAGATEEQGYRWTLDAVQRHPDRFRLSVRFDPRAGFGAVRELERQVREDGAGAVRIVPFRHEAPLTDPIYAPLFAKCIELGLPVTSTVGIPGPLVRGKFQDVLYLDDLCAAWPDLVLVTTHGGEPWTRLLALLLAKWPNLYHMISAFAPRYYPADTIDFLNTEAGRSKVMFATDYPMISFERALAELPSVPLAEASWEPFLFGNAARVFWHE